jgi:peptidylprolyl isomerase
MSEVEGREDAGTEEMQADEVAPEQPQEEAKQPSSGPKVKMPQAKDISRPDFTPHALGAKGRPAPRSGTRAAAKRRRIIYTGIGVVVVAALAVGGVAYANRPKPSVKVTGAFGAAPKMSVPKATPSSTKQIKEIIHGTGPAITKDDFVVLHLVGYQWSHSGGKELLNTYKAAKPVAGKAAQLTQLPALDNELPGLKAGTRLELTLPYKDLTDQIGQALKLAKTDDFVVSVDVMNVFGKTAQAQGTPVELNDAKLPSITPGAPGKAPTVKVPKASPPSKLVVKTLIQGNGPAVKKGQTLIANYHGVIWDTGKVFDSSWQHGSPASFPIGVGQVIPAWDNGLVGVKAGSRMLLVVPPKDGYGAKGSQDGGIKGTDTLVFVVDVLGAF